MPAWYKPPTSPTTPRTPKTEPIREPKRTPLRRPGRVGTSSIASIIFDFPVAMSPINLFGLVFVC